MGLLTGISNMLFSQNNIKISEKLDKIGYFKLVTDSSKLINIKKDIDDNYENGKSYNETNWLILSNDYYISSVFGLKENGNNSSTSDFRSFEVWAGDLFEQNLESYINSAKVVFEKNGLELNWKDEKIDWNKESNYIENVHHTININNKKYTIYSGNVSDKTKRPAFEYLTNFRKILNEVLFEQKSKNRIILLSAPEYVYFIMLEEEMFMDFKKIIEKTKNKIEK